MAPDIKWSSAADLDLRYGYAGTAITMIFFQVLNHLLSRSKRPKTISEADDWKWRNLLISWVHALICGIWNLSCFVLYPEMFGDLLTYGNYTMYFLLAFSTGYFMYDFVDMLLNNMLLRMWEVTLHHIAVTSMFMYNVLTGQSIAYNMVALLAEVNSFFLHSRKLMQMMHVGFRHWLYRLVATLNLITFAVFRGLSLGGITYGLYIWPHRVSKIYYYTLSFSMFIMNVINPVLFWRLLKNDFLRKERESSHESPKHAVKNGNLSENGILSNSPKHIAASPELVNGNDKLK